MSLKLLSEIAKHINILDKRIARLETLEGSSFTGGDGLVLIERQEVGAAGTNLITFNNIPATFHQLWVIYYAYAYQGTGGWGPIEMRINNDSGANYDWYDVRISWNLAAPSKGQAYGDSQARVGNANDDARLDPAAGHILFPCYSDTTPASKRKVWIWDLYLTGWFAGAPDHQRHIGGGDWLSNAAISRLDFAPTFAAPAFLFQEGTCFSVYGIG